MRPDLGLTVLLLVDSLGGTGVVDASWTSGRRRSAGPAWTTEADIEVRYSCTVSSAEDAAQRSSARFYMKALIANIPKHGWWCEFLVPWLGLCANLTLSGSRDRSTGEIKSSGSDHRHVCTVSTWLRPPRTLQCRDVPVGCATAPLLLLRQTYHLRPCFAMLTPAMPHFPLRTRAI